MSVKNRADLIADAGGDLPNNTTKAISAADIRLIILDIIDSFFNLKDDVFPKLNVVDEKAAGTDGGTFTSGAYRTRDLNTVRTNGIIGASVATNQITLPAGTYEVEWSAPALTLAQNKTRFRNITDSTTIIVGESSYADDNAGHGHTSVSRGYGVFTIGDTKVFELQHQAAMTRTADGFGISSNFTEVEVYAQVTITEIKIG